MKGWQPVGELTRWAFAQAPVVMANEAHSGLLRCVRTRQVGARMVRAAHEAGGGNRCWSGPATTMPASSHRTMGGFRWATSSWPCQAWSRS
jgi:hypothetical protein